MPSPFDEPLHDLRVFTAGVTPSVARAAVILLHGRGGEAEDMLRLARVLRVEGVAFIVPEAPGRAWYPQRFLAPLEANEPRLSRRLAAVHALIDRLAREGIQQDCVVLGGFSQGACLTLEAAVRRGGRFGGLFGLSGALMGPPGEPRPLDCSLDGTPVFLGCSDVDPHIPLASVRETERTLQALGAAVICQIYPGADHAIFPVEIDLVRTMVEAAGRL